MGRLIQLPLRAKSNDEFEEYGERPIGTNEKKSVIALVAYVAKNRRTDEDTVITLLNDRFGIDSISDIKEKTYEEVIRFLVDLKLDETIH